MGSKIIASFLILAFTSGSGRLFANDPLKGSDTRGKEICVFAKRYFFRMAPLGADFRNLLKTEAIKLGIAGGVVVTGIHEGGALSNQTKMQAGFVITRIGDFPVTSIAGMNDALSRQKNHFVIQGIYPVSKQTYYYSIREF